jgi:hypothetical protein
MRRLRRGRGSSAFALVSPGLVYGLGWLGLRAYFGRLGDGFAEYLDFEVTVGGVELCVRVSCIPGENGQV